MTNPYRGNPDYTFWKRAVSDQPYEFIDLVTQAPFTIAKADKVATAGSCFAQHIARTLDRSGFNYFVPETFDPESGAADENFGVFSARFGNIYSTRQLIQLFDRAYNLSRHSDDHWVSETGRYLDPFRPLIQNDGFRSLEDLHRDRERHLAAVRAMFEDADVFIFTLGLTETWVSKSDGTAFPLAPGVAKATVDPSRYEFRNFSVEEMDKDLGDFLDNLRTLNPAIRVLLTVSPVPLIATYEDRHVVLSTELSKAALRVTADRVAKNRPNVAYFPSYEIITSHFNPVRLFDADMRNVSTAGVDKVMGIFKRHYLTDSPQTFSAPAPASATPLPDNYAELAAVVCDEEAIVR